MSELIQMGNRAKQILNALYENGPLSSSTLRTIIEPTMCSRSMNAAIKRLYDLGLVKNRHASISKYRGRFIQLANGEGHQMLLSQVLNIPKENLSRVPGGTEALEHWQDCAVWSKRFRAIPEAKVIRDFQIASNKAALETLLMNPQELDLLPDMILRLPKIGKKGSVNVGIEIERTQKSQYRIMQKLRKFASRTRLDGVLYICTRASVARKIASVYTKQVQAKALRVQHYAANFLLISDGSIEKQKDLIVQNSESKNISFDSWIHLLRSKEMSERGHFHVTP